VSGFFTWTTKLASGRIFNSSYKIKQKTGVRFKRVESVGGIFAWTTNLSWSECPIPPDREKQEACQGKKR
jgi:hypothetical protein